ncbi:MAG: O-antigen ligase family protein [Actinomycetota bacterium]|nr:O-antigen ligase family protein [Actinomycetota bacterium]
MTSTLPQSQVDPAPPRGSPAPPGERSRLGPLEMAYGAAVIQTVLYNPVIASRGTLQIYLNTMVWPVVAAAALVRWARTKDVVLKRALKATSVATAVLLWVVLLQIGLGPREPYAVGNLLRLLYVPMALAAGLAVYRSSRRLLDVSLLAVGLKCLLMIMPLLKGPIDLVHRLTVPELGGHNTFAAFLVLLVVLRASTWVLADDRPPKLVIASMAVCVAAIFLTFSRGAFLALAAGVAAFLVMAVLRSRRPGRAAKAALLLIIVMSPLVVAEPIQSRLSPASLGQSSGRDEIWQPAWRGFLARPLVGHGFGSFEAYSSTIVDLTDPTVVGGVTYSAHSLPLQVLYEGGLLGLLLLVSGVTLVLRATWNRVIGPVVVAFVVDSFFETFPHVVQVSWILGLILAISLLHRSAVPRASTPRYWP